MLITIVGTLIILAGLLWLIESWLKGQDLYLSIPAGMLMLLSAVLTGQQFITNWSSGLAEGEAAA